MLIVIEGADGVGKTTVSKALAEKLRARWIEFPDRSTFSGEVIDAWLKKEVSLCSLTREGRQRAPLGYDPRTLQALFAVNRYERLTELEEALRGRDLVVSRYVPSGLVYGEVSGADRFWLRAIHAGLPEPDLSILLDLDPAIAMGRERRALDPELYEQLEVQHKVRRLYLDLWKEHRDHGDGRYVHVDASDSFEGVVNTCLIWYETRRRHGMRE